jgi:predicted O-methyltransferase YrrM
MNDHIDKSFARTQCFESKIADAALHEIGGMSGVKTRHLYNNICSLNKPIRYLEVGSYTGSTICAALYKNPHVTAWAYDNFSEFDGTLEKLEENVQKYIPDANLTIKKEDFFTATELPSEIDVFLYDGPHGRENHRDAIVKIWPHLAAESIIIVDDWNWSEVRDGTYQGFLDVGAKIQKTWEIKHTWDNTHTQDSNTRAYEFWNGIAVFDVRKQEY